MSKCKFGRIQIDYLGHIITENGIVVDPRKMDSITNWPLPRTPKEMHGFLGLIGYYCKFIKGY